MSQKQSSKQRAQMAINTMKIMGFSAHKTRDVLRNLVKTYDNNWEYIEADNYGVLVEAILDDESEVPEPQKKNTGDFDVDSRKKEALASDEPELCKKRVRTKQEEQKPSPSAINSVTSGEGTLKRPKLEVDALPQTSTRQENVGISLRSAIRERDEAELLQPPMRAEAELLQPPKPKERETADRIQKMVALKEPKAEPEIDFEVPIAMICPTPPSSSAVRKEANVDRSNRRAPDASETLKAQKSVMENGKDSVSDAICKGGTNEELQSFAGTCSTNIDVASSPMGEVKLSLSFNSAADPNFHMPNLESVLKRVEERCLKSYKFIHPTEFSLMDLMKEMCQCAVELGTESSEDKEEHLVTITPNLDSLKSSSLQNTLDGLFASSSNGSPDLPLPQVPGLVAMNGLRRNLPHNRKTHENSEAQKGKKMKVLDVSEPPEDDSRSLVVFRQHEPALGDVRPLHDAGDITKGEERVRISLVNEVNSEQFPASFYYIPHNIVYQHAYINFSLARIGDENCCSDCFGNCMSASIPCACARETGGEYAYSPEGLLKTVVLDEFISISRSPHKDHFFYCKDCPLERAKNEVNPDPCKGHLVRKFIKECWSKCGCNKQCGNRVVQRGIICNLQVFYTDKGKGWGLRTLDELPKGTFVCEYVGEVLTNMELYDRTLQTTGNAKHTYPVLLDADWGSEGVLKDEDALCLDATFYGNVARFINHRCFDANLVEIPVEVETPDHHYYHLAFFTTRKIDAFEELTWDYGIDFDDHSHPVKAFRCLCGSKCCRDMKRKSKSRAKALVVK